MRNKIRKKILYLLLAGILAAGRVEILWTRSGDAEDTGCNDRLNLQKVLFGRFLPEQSSSHEHNINVSFDGPAAEEDYETQNEMVRRAMDDGVDVIIFSPVDYDAMPRSLIRRHREGSRSS